MVARSDPQVSQSNVLTKTHMCPALWGFVSPEEPVFFPGDF